jgi:VanZ family protein
MHRFMHFCWLWLPVLIWMALMFWWSGIPHLAIATGAADFWTRKPAHIAEYAVLFLLLYRATTSQRLGIWSLKHVSICIGLTLLFAMSDEWHQSFTPSRHGSVVDIGIDSLGVALGLLVLAWYGWWQRVTESTNI